MDESTTARVLLTVFIHKKGDMLRYLLSSYKAKTRLRIDWPFAE